MRHLRPIMMGIFLATATAAIPACNTTTPDEVVETSQAQLVLSLRGSSSATLHVTATADVSGEVVLDQTIDVKGDSAAFLDLSLEPESYTFHVEAFADAEATTSLGSGSGKATLHAGITTQIKLVTTIDAEGGASVEVGANSAPKIHGIDVSISGSSELDATAHITIDATDEEGDELSYFWSGFGIEGAVHGSASIDLSAVATLSSESSFLRVIVQDKWGATAEATLDFDAKGDCSFCGGFDSSVSISVDVELDADLDVNTHVDNEDTDTDLDVSIDLCLEAHAQCTVDCDAELALHPLAIVAHVACLAQCSLELATCND